MTEGYKIRLRFSKTGRMKYISHLDLMSTLQRAFIRAGIRLKYSQGFNPHPYLSVALPLSVGVGSACELIDIKTEDNLSDDFENLPERLSAVLPDGIKIFEAYEPQRKFSQIKWVGISGILRYNNIPSDIAERMTERLRQDEIVIEKKAKRGVSEMNIAPHMRDVRINHYSIDISRGFEEPFVLLTALLSAQNPSITSGNLLSAFENECAYLKPDFAGFTRIKVFDENLELFR